MRGTCIESSPCPCYPPDPTFFARPHTLPPPPAFTLSTLQATGTGQFVCGTCMESSPCCWRQCPLLRQGPCSQLLLGRSPAEGGA